MADDLAPSTTEAPEVEEIEGKDEEQESSTSSDADRNSDANKGEEEGSSGYFSRMFQKTIGGDDLESRIELIDKEEESLESRMIIRERTAEQVNRSMIFLSLNLEAVNIGFTVEVYVRDIRLLERLRKEREAKIQELKERANYYMAKTTHIQNCHGGSLSVASSSRSNLPEASDTRDGIVKPNLSYGKSKPLDPGTSTNLDACKTVVNDSSSKKKLRNLVICTTCRMHNGFASRDELPFISYKCQHCNALNGSDKEQKGSDKGAPPSQPYNPFSIPEMPRGIFIEEITPNHEITGPEMDAPVMIIRESPSINGGEEESPSDAASVTVRKLPNGLFIEEMNPNQETNDTEMETPVMIVPESPATVTPLEEENERGLSIEEISPNHQQIEDREMDSPVMFVQESPSIDLRGQNSAAVTPVTVPEMPSGLSIEEMTPNQEMADPETEPPLMIIQDSPSAGALVMGDSAFVTPLTAQEMASGLSIEEVSPNYQQIEDHEMDSPVMFVQELLVSTPDPASGLSIEEISPNHLGNEDNEMEPPVMFVQGDQIEDHEMDSPVMFVQESPSLDGQELLASTPDPSPGLSTEELSPNHLGNEDHEMEPPVMFVQGDQIEDHEMDSPVMFVQESPSLDGQELLASTPDPSPGLSIEELSPNHQQIEDQEMDSPVMFVQGDQIEDHEMDSPVMFVQESPSLGGQELLASTPDPAPGLSTEELSPNHLGNEDHEMEPPVMFVQGDQIEDHEMDSPVMFVQESPSLGAQELLVSTPDPAPGLSIEKLSPNHLGNEDHEMEPPVMIIQDSPSVTPLELPEITDDTIHPDGNVRSPNDSISWSTPGSSTFTGSSVTFQDLPELGQEEDINDHEVQLVSSDNENLARYLHENGTVSCDPVTATAVTNYESDSNSWRSAGSGPVAVTNAEMHPKTGEKLPSKSQQMDLNLPYSESETDSDYGSLADVNEEEAATQDPETRVAGSSVTVPNEETNDLFTSAYDERNSVVSGDEEQWSDWQSGPTSETKISERLNLTVEETQLVVGEMPLNDAREEGAEGSVSGNSDAAEESLAGSEDYTDHRDPNCVGSLAYDRDKGSSSQISRKEVGGMKKDGVLQDKKRREGERVKEDISDKEGSIKKQIKEGIKPEPAVKASATPLSPNSGLDPPSKPLTGIVSSPAAPLSPNLGLDPQSRPLTGTVSSPAPQWGTDPVFERSTSVGLRQRK